MEEQEQAKAKVCILTAGIGSRLEERTKYFNKALLRVGNKAVISHTIDHFDDDTEFVIGLGYKGNIVKQYLELAHPQKKFTFIEIDKYSEPGAGPGYAMLKCEEELRCPFFFVSCDSLISWDFACINAQSKSWAGWDHIEDPTQYCTIEENSGKIEKIIDKKTFGTDKAFVGVAFIKEYEEFWALLHQQKPTVNEEIQVAPAILNMSNMHAHHVTWYDTGSKEGLLEARNHFKGLQNLDKLDEELYFIDKYVVKYFHNSSISNNRVARTKIMGSTVPEIIAHSNNFYKYNFVSGRDLFKIENPQDIILDLLNYAQENLWSKTASLDDVDKKIFKDVCKKFYYDKTLMRLEKLYSKIDLKERDNIINDQHIPPLNQIFCRVNWDWLADGVAAKFHGDFNFSNIVYGENKFKFLDWRQDFGGSIEYGDIYYDFAKMYHSFLFPHPSVKAGKFYVYKRPHKDLGWEKIKTFVEVPYHIEKCKDIFEEFLVDNGYNLWKTKILTAIVLLNMSPLHESPMDEYLYYFAKSYLHEVLSV
jgi:NDP-sugar pyrophosphorylase family protein